jgi:hypothetical protein
VKIPITNLTGSTDPAEMISPASLVIAILLGIPSLLVLGAYLWLALDHGTLWLFPAVVHESGDYTLLQTILYFRHVIRELPITLLYAISSVAAFKVYGPTGHGPIPRSKRYLIPAVFVLVVVSVSWFMTINTWGVEVALQEVLQGYTRDDTFLPGSHWPFHLLSTIGYFLAAIIVAALLHYGIHGTLPPRRPTVRSQWIGGTIVAILAMTILLGLTTAPFLDPRYIGHQARELLTHLSITLPLSFGVLLRETRTASGSITEQIHRDEWIGQRHVKIVTPSRRIYHDLIAAAAVLFLGLLFLVGGTLLTGAVGHARPGTPLSSLVAAHLFEHTVDYLLVACLILTTWRATATRDPVSVVDNQHRREDVNGR